MYRSSFVLDFKHGSYKDVYLDSWNEQCVNLCYITLLYCAVSKPKLRVYCKQLYNTVIISVVSDILNFV